MKNKQQRAVAIKGALGAFCDLSGPRKNKLKAAAAGAGLPWEAPLQTITRRHSKDR